MVDIPPLYDVHLLKFHVEVFAKTAVSNGIWLMGEWHAQKPRDRREFSPKLQHLFEPRCWPEALRTLEGFDSTTRFRIFAVSFMYHANAGESLFQRLISMHPEMLREALDAEWMRVRSRVGRTGIQFKDNDVAKERLHRIADSRYDSQLSKKE
ncbi:MAG: hypothetical protein K2Z80_28645 [Xanthobacteraceae bacterium]|nr:hypothetical protein [Xanthobacteraceae bacterium]